MPAFEANADDMPTTRGVRFGIGSRLYAAFGAVTGLTLVATAVSWVAFENVRGTLDNVSGRAVPILTSSLQLAAEAATAAAMAPNINSATARVLDAAGEPVTTVGLGWMF